MSNPVLSRTTPYQAITLAIVEAMKGDLRAFKMPWHTAGSPAQMPVNAATDAPYRGVNILSLWIGALHGQYPSGYWASYKQWQLLGSQVRKGERGTPMVFFKPLLQGEAREGESDSPRFVARTSHVFNSAQVEGWVPPDLPTEPSFNVDEQAEAFMRATKARIRYGFHMAKYRPDLDDIEMPSPAWFTGSPTSSPLHAFYAVLLHELTHWTGAAHRLNRECGKRFADHAYAMEELVAELGAAFLCAALGLANEPRPDHAQYLSSWLAVLEADTRAVFFAAGRAQEAVEYLDKLTMRND